MEQVDLPVLLEGAWEMGCTVDKASARLKEIPQGEFSFCWDSPVGKIALNGQQIDRYVEGPYLLTIDTGGDDRYLARATQSQGQGHDWSIGLLHDAQGDDTYECPKCCLGTGVWNGIGIFWDQAGDDVYKAQDNCFGYAGPARPSRGA
jgi:hypothetical protein